MLSHFASGPIASGTFVVAYRLPFSTVVAVACECTSMGQAKEAAAHLNEQQRQQEQELRAERMACGLRWKSSH